MTNHSTRTQVEQSIAAKQACRPKVDSQGRPVGEPVAHTYGPDGRLIETEPK